MIVIWILIPVCLLLGGGFLAAFIWAVRSGQYEDTGTPALRVLLEDRAARPDGCEGLSDEQSKNES